MRQIGHLPDAELARRAIFPKLGTDDQHARKLARADPERADGTFLPEVRAGEYWRLITPILLPSLPRAERGRGT